MESNLTQASEGATTAAILIQEQLYVTNSLAELVTSLIKRSFRVGYTSLPAYGAS